MRKCHKRYQGQGLVEFALLLPVLLLILLGTIEWGRIFFIYVNINNAAREGTRYGMVHPTDQNGITNHVTDRLALVSPSDLLMNISYDNGPGTSPISVNQVTTSARVIVTLRYTIQPLTPLMSPFIPGGLAVTSENRRTIQSARADTPSTLAAPAPPGSIPQTNTPTPGAHNTDTPTPLPTETPPAIATSTPTSTATPTPTPSPTPLPLRIDKPVVAGDTEVTGTAAPGYGVTLRVIQTGLQRTVAVNADGTFSYSGLPELVAGHTVVVQGYGQQDLAIVQDLDATPTPTPTETPTATPLPTGGYIFVDGLCFDEGTQTITVHGRQIPRDSSFKDVQFTWDGVPIDVQGYTFGDQAFDLDVTITIDGLDPETHTLGAQMLNNQRRHRGYDGDHRLRLPARAEARLDHHEPRRHGHTHTGYVPAGASLGLCSQRRHR